MQSGAAISSRQPLTRLIHDGRHNHPRQKRQRADDANRPAHAQGVRETPGEQGADRVSTVAPKPVPKSSASVSMFWPIWESVARRSVTGERIVPGVLKPYAVQPSMALISVLTIGDRRCRRWSIEYPTPIRSTNGSLTSESPNVGST